MKSLTISIDMGAKNNGIFIVEQKNQTILSKKTTNIIFDKINFSKKSRRENRHKVRNIKRRKLSKRLLWEIFDKEKFTQEQQELIQGLLNNRGYTFLSTSSEFERVEDITSEYLAQNIKELEGYIKKEDFEKYLSNFEDEEELVSKIDELIEKLTPLAKLNKKDFSKDFKENYKTIKDDLKILKDFFSKVKDEIKTGSKPRKRYLQEIKQEIENFDFINDKDNFYNIVGNIANMQLRVLRRYFNQKFDNNFDDKKLQKKLNDYFRRFHDAEFKKVVLNEFNRYSSSLEFLKMCNPLVTIPPYEDMNNRDTYKCNSMLIKESIITPTLKNSIDKLLSKQEFDTINDNTLSYPQKLQRLLDINSKIIAKEINPREVFKYKRGNYKWYKNLLKEDYDEFKNIAQKFYTQEESIIQGIYNNSFIFTKCNHNTPYKNNIKHILLKPLYSYEFSEDEASQFIVDIENIKGLKKALQRVSEVAKEYQNSFYHIVEACFENQKCIDDKEIKLLIKNLPNNVDSFKKILDGKDTYFSKIEQIDSSNLKRVLNIFKQTYEILFKDIKGFNKTCKHCTIENSLRSYEDRPLAKRLLSDVAKPIDGMLDMMLDRLSFEIVEQIDSLDEIEKIEILLEQNRFEFEEGLAQIKNKKPKKRGYKNPLEPNICPYTGKKFEKGEYDHILPQSKELFNSKANLIYASVEGNRAKSNKDYQLQELSSEHLKAIFKSDDLNKIEEFISKNLALIDEDKFRNFDNLKLNEQIAFRYALFLDRNSDEFKKAKRLLQKDKIRTFSNGTQKRLARFLSQKLNQKFNKEIQITSKVVDAKVVSATRFELSVDQKTGEINELFKEEKQNSHSHCVDAMVVFYTANQNYDFFQDIYLNESNILNIQKRKTFINAKDIKSYKLFDDTIYSENFKHITKENKEKEIKTLIKQSLLYENIRGKKHYIQSFDEIQRDKVYKIDRLKVVNLLQNLLLKKDEASLKELKFLDNYTYYTSKKDILNIFFDDKQTKLIEFSNIKSIPPYQEKTYKAIYKKLQNCKNLFVENKLNIQVYEKLMKSIFKSTGKKRNKKRHIFSLPVLGSPKFRVKRDGTWHILSNKDIATKNYIINGNIKAIPYFSKNTIPLKVKDIIECVALPDGARNIYEVKIKIENDVTTQIRSLKYFVTEAKRLTVEVELIKSGFPDIDFNQIKIFDGGKDDEFKKFLECYIQNKEISLYRYIGSIRDALKGKATLLNNSNTTIKLSYKADTNKEKKELILKNYETSNI